MPGPTDPHGFDPARQLEIARRAIAKNSFCVLATASAANRPHAVGISYAAVDLTLYLLTDEGSVKTRNVRANPAVAVSIPVRKYPMAPPMAVQFQGTARVLPVDEPEVRELLAAGRLRRIARLGALEHPGVCVIEVRPGKRISTYGLGLPLHRLLRDLSAGARSVELP